MLTVSCVLKSGSYYDAEWVGKLQRGVARHMSHPHRFVCLSDVEVPCERIPLKHDWPGWWSKIELFSLDGLMLYFDLDTVITGSIDGLANLPHDFAMLRSFSAPNAVGSGVMWFRKTPHQVYEKFARMPECYIEHHERNADAETAYVGDQSFIHDCLGDVPLIDLPEVKSYKRHCRNKLPPDASVVCFHGVPRPPEVQTEWMARSWV
jgi:hypothetical protein